MPAGCEPREPPAQPSAGGAPHPVPAAAPPPPPNLLPQQQQQRPTEPESPAQPKAFKRKIAVLSAKGPAPGSTQDPEPSAGGANTTPSPAPSSNAVTAPPQPPSSSSCAGGGRKRRWGASTACAPKRPSISITTDSLKSLIPEMKSGAAIMAAAAPDAVVELHPDEGPMSEEEGGGVSAGGSQSASLPARLPSPHNPPLKICRTVTQVVQSDGQENGQDSAPSDDVTALRKPDDDHALPAITPTPPPPPPPPPPASGEAPPPRRPAQPRPLGLTLPIDDPVRAAPRPSPPRARPTPIVHLCNLVRPFTLGQLKELLGRTGRLRDDGFWIDKIKSHCYVTYASVEEAVATRNALHGVKWPQSNPKVLAADFAEQEELDFHRGLLSEREEGPGGYGGSRGGAAIPPPPPSSSSSVTSSSCRGGGPREAERAQRAEREREMERRERTRGEREWDRDKGAAPARTPSRSPPPGGAAAPGRGGANSAGGGANMAAREAAARARQRGGSEKDRAGRGARDPRNDKREKPPEEPPAKLLDDLFRKTKAAPCIYWLPLTDTQFVQKQAERAARARERERRRKEQEEEEQRQRGGTATAAMTAAATTAAAGNSSSSAPVSSSSSSSRDKRGAAAASSSSTPAVSASSSSRDRASQPNAAAAAERSSHRGGGSGGDHHHHHHHHHHHREHRRGDKRRSSRSRSRSTPLRDRGGRR